MHSDAMGEGSCIDAFSRHSAALPGRYTSSVNPSAWFAVGDQWRSTPSSKIRLFRILHTMGYDALHCGTQETKQITNELTHNQIDQLTSIYPQRHVYGRVVTSVKRKSFDLQFYNSSTLLMFCYINGRNFNDSSRSQERNFLMIIVITRALEERRYPPSRRG